MQVNNTFSTMSYQLRHELVLACHILVAKKLDSGPFGNISVRIPGTQQYWINPCAVTFDQIMVEDILRVDFEGKILEGNRQSHPGEIIHREIYRLRPDVAAIVHTHSENTVMHSLLGVKIEPFTQLGASIYNDQGIYTGFTGPVRSSAEGYEIASALKNYSVVIAKNHGLFTAAATLQEALWDFMICDTAAKIHLQAIQMGLKHAQLISDEYLTKSKQEVRQKQNKFMWASFMNSLSV